MTQILRQSTQIVVHVGPFVDFADGLTPETGVTLSGADEAELLKAGATTTTSISGATWAAITSCDGWYALTLTTSLTDTVGPLDIIVQDDSLCLPVHARFQVIEEAAYDALFAASAAPATAAGVSAVETDTQDIQTRLPAALTGGGNIKADMLAIAGGIAEALKLLRGAGALIIGQCDDYSTDTVIQTNLQETTENHFNGAVIAFVGGALDGQRDRIVGYHYNGVNGEVTVTGLTEAPLDGQYYVIS